MIKHPYLAAGLAMFAALLAGCKDQQAGEPIIRTEIGKGSQDRVAAKKAQSDCKDVTFEGAKFTDCVADPVKHRIAMVLGDEQGDKYRSLRSYGQALGDDALDVAFAMNAGMFDAEGKPIGYYVENYERLQELNRADGPGNFHMKPNGVFYGTNGKWEIRTADSFYYNVGDRPEFGTQSGPMLVINGELHPQMQDDGPSKAIRNGVGIDGNGRAHFVISNEPVSFGQFARLFRDQLKAANALFLDGNISALWDPVRERLDAGNSLGPMVVVTKRGGLKGDGAAPSLDVLTPADKAGAQ